MTAPIGVGVIGVGYWGPNLLRNFNNASGASARWAADLDEGRLAHIGKLYPGVTTTTDYRQMLEDDETHAEILRETGIGTPATRADIIENLIAKGYAVRLGKALRPTVKGIRLIDVVHPQVKSPEMTGRWEAELNRIQRGNGSDRRCWQACPALTP